MPGVECQRAYEQRENNTRQPHDQSTEQNKSHSYRCNEALVSSVPLISVVQGILVLLAFAQLRNHDLE